MQMTADKCQLSCVFEEVRVHVLLLRRSDHRLAFDPPPPPPPPPLQKCRATTMAESLPGKRERGAVRDGGLLEGFILVMVIALLVWKWDHWREPHSV